MGIRTPGRVQCVSANPPPGAQLGDRTRVGQRGLRPAADSLHGGTRQNRRHIPDAPATSVASDRRGDALRGAPVVPTIPERGPSQPETSKCNRAGVPCVLLPSRKAPKPESGSREPDVPPWDCRRHPSIASRKVVAIAQAAVPGRPRFSLDNHGASIQRAPSVGFGKRVVVQAQARPGRRRTPAPGTGRGRPGWPRDWQGGERRPGRASVLRGGSRHRPFPAKHQASPWACRWPHDSRPWRGRQSAAVRLSGSFAGAARALLPSAGPDRGTAGCRSIR